MTTSFDLYFRQTADADGDDISRKVGTVDADDLDRLKSGNSALLDLINYWGGLLGDPSGYDVSGQFTDRGFEIVFSEPF